MPNEYIAHKEEWKALADIDYFGMPISMSHKQRHC